MKFMALGLLVTIGTSGMAIAQTTDGLCHHAGLTYSPGAMITMGQSMQRCSVADGGISIWSPVVSEDDSKTSANCVSGGREFGQGSVLPAGSIELKCSKGIWYPAN